MAASNEQPKTSSASNTGSTETLQNILTLIALLAQYQHPSSTVPTSIHPSIPNPLFTPPTTPTTTITIDASTRIVGHCNTIHIPAPAASDPPAARTTSTEPTTPMDLLSPLSDAVPACIPEALLKALNSRVPVSPYSLLFLSPGAPAPAVKATPSAPVAPKVELKIDTGVRICGSKNLVVLGARASPVRQLAGVKRKADVVS